MKKTAALIMLLSLFTAAPLAQGGYSTEDYQKGLLDAFRCFSDIESFKTGYPDDWKTLRKAYITNPATQTIAQICSKKQRLYILREERTATSQKVRAGIYDLKKRKKYFEKKAHDFEVLCTIQDSTTTRRLNYLCYNPTVGAAVTTGEEFSFRILSRKSYRRICEVSFPESPMTSCKKWKALK